MSSHHVHRLHESLPCYCVATQDHHIGEERYVSTQGETLARRFHEAYERLAPSFGYETRTETRHFDPTTPNGRLMIAVCDEVGTIPRETLIAVYDAVSRSNITRDVKTPDKKVSVVIRALTGEP